MNDVQFAKTSSPIYTFKNTDKYSGNTKELPSYLPKSYIQLLHYYVASYISSLYIGSYIFQTESSLIWGLDHMHG